MAILSEREQAESFPLPPYNSLSGEELTARIQTVRQKMGNRLLILGHHYQRDEVIALSDLQGDSYQLSTLAAENKECRAIIFCGVHFMAETADILANRPERVKERGGERIPIVLPDLEAGCSMADMAAIEQVQDCWRQLGQVVDLKEVIPVTYVNSAAALKAFCGGHGGTVCTSANADAALRWAFSRGRRVLFFPDQHLGRNTASKMGISPQQMPIWDPQADELGGNTRQTIQQARVILWKGFCSVHQVFRPEHVDYFRSQYPGIRILVHPECMREVVEKADVVGSTGKIIRTVEESPAGTKWAIGTELNLVNRLKWRHPEQEIHLLAPAVAVCSTMFRIDLPHLCWVAENLAAGTPVNVIRVDDATAAEALVALLRMLELKD